jgi:hypothetical protein
MLADFRHGRLDLAESDPALRPDDGISLIVDTVRWFPTLPSQSLHRSYGKVAAKEIGEDREALPDCVYRAAIRS